MATAPLVARPSPLDHLAEPICRLLIGDVFFNPRWHASRLGKPQLTNKIKELLAEYYNNYVRTNSELDALILPQISLDISDMPSDSQYEKIGDCIKNFDAYLAALINNILGNIVERLLQYKLSISMLKAYLAGAPVPASTLISQLAPPPAAELKYDDTINDARKEMLEMTITPDRAIVLDVAIKLYDLIEDAQIKVKGSIFDQGATIITGLEKLKDDPICRVVKTILTVQRLTKTQLFALFAQLSKWVIYLNPDEKLAADFFVKNPTLQWLNTLRSPDTKIPGYQKMISFLNQRAVPAGLKYLHPALVIDAAKKLSSDSIVLDFAISLYDLIKFTQETLSAKPAMISVTNGLEQIKNQLIDDIITKINLHQELSAMVELTSRLSNWAHDLNPEKKLEADYFIKNPSLSWLEHYRTAAPSIPSYQNKIALLSKQIRARLDSMTEEFELDQNVEKARTLVKNFVLPDSKPTITDKSTYLLTVAINLYDFYRPSIDVDGKKIKRIYKIVCILMESILHVEKSLDRDELKQIDEALNSYLVPSKDIKKVNAVFFRGRKTAIPPEASLPLPTLPTKGISPVASVQSTVPSLAKAGLCPAAIQPAEQNAYKIGNSSKVRQVEIKDIEDKVERKDSPQP